MSASAPPPPPFQSAPPVRPATAWDRRALRDQQRALRNQRRAAALQAKQVASLQRAQLRAARRTSILGPFLLLSLGLLFLLFETNGFPPALGVMWFSRWWPLLLIGAGFVLLVEWAFDSWIAAQRNVAPPRRRVGGGTAFLLVMLALAGVSMMAAQNRRNWLVRNWNPELTDSLGLDQLFAQHSETELDLSAPLNKGGLLTVQNFRGNITVTGSSQDGLVHVSVHQRLSAWQRSDLRAKQQRDKPVLERSGSGLLLRAAGEDRDSTDLTIDVPHESALVIAPDKGDVSVSELRGPVSVKDHRGNVSLTALTGDVHLVMADDDATISGRSLTGDVTVDGRSGDLSLSEVTGPVSLSGDFFGTTHLQRVTGPVHVRSSFTDFTCVGIPGELNIEGRSELQATNLTGPVILTTSDRNVELRGVRNGATLTNRNGSVTLSLADPLAPVKVDTTNGSVELGLPEKSAFDLSAETANGQVSNEWGFSPKQEGDRTTLVGQARSGGPSLALHTTEGDIRVRKGSGAATDDQADTSDNEEGTDGTSLPGARPDSRTRRSKPAAQ